MIDKPSDQKDYDYGDKVAVCKQDRKERWDVHPQTEVTERIDCKKGDHVTFGEQVNVAPRNGPYYETKRKRNQLYHWTELRPIKADDMAYADMESDDIKPKRPFKGRRPEGKAE